MNRPFDEEIISAYLDDELSAEERRDVEQLLADRPEARRLLDELRGIREGLQALPVYRLKEDFGTAVLRQAEREMLRAAAPPASSNVVASANALSSLNGAVAEAPRGEITPAAMVEHNWRRPIAWSLLAVAAAVVLMYVDRQRHAPQPLAMNKTPAGAVTAPQAEVAGKLGAQNEATDKQADKLTGLFADQDRAAGDAGIAAKPSVSPAPVVAKVAAGMLPPLGNQLAVMNAAPGGVPPNGAAGIAGGQFAVGNTIPTQNGTLTLNGGQVPAATAPAENNGVDMTPLIATNDYNRARSLVAEYQEVRRDVADERLAVEALSQRMQQPQSQTIAKNDGLREQQQSARRAAPSDQLLIVQCDITPEALERGLAPILVREQIADLTTVQQSQQSVSRSSLNFATGALDAVRAEEKLKAQREGAPAARPQDGEATEEFLYVVADAKQLEATLDALRRQSDYFVNVRVEPAPADAQQQQWRSYSRGLNTGGRNAIPTVASPSVTSPAAAPNALSAGAPSPKAAGPAPAGGSLTGDVPTTNAPAVAATSTAAPTASAVAAKKTETKAQDQKLATELESNSVAKAGRDAIVAKQLADIAKLRGLDQSQQVGGGSGGGRAIPATPPGSAPFPTTSPAAITQPNFSNDLVQQQALSPAGQPLPPAGPSAAGQGAQTQAVYGQSTQQQGFYGYDSRTAQPLSRAQRLSQADVAELPARGNVKEGAANGTLQANGERSPTNGAALAAAGEKSVPPQPTAPGTPQVAATSTPAPAKAAPPADAAQAKAKDESGKSNADTLGRNLAAPSNLGDAERRKLALQSDEPVWYGLPPDYHEALFIFRVVNNKPAAAQPTADVKQDVKQNEAKPGSAAQPAKP